MKLFSSNIKLFDFENPRLEGMTKQFGDNDTRELKTTDSGKLRWVNADGRVKVYNPNRKKEFNSYQELRNHARARQLRVPEGNLGFKRSEMPQIRSQYKEQFLDNLLDEGILITKKGIPAKDLKPTQSEVNMLAVLHVMEARPYLSETKQVIVSNDNYILDGHHRAIAQYNLDPKGLVSCVVVDLPIEELIERAKDFENVEFSTVEDMDAYAKSLFDLTYIEKTDNKMYKSLFGEQIDAFPQQPKMTVPKAHKYIEKHINPKTGKYIYIYEMPNGKRYAKDDSGATHHKLDNFDMYADKKQAPEEMPTPDPRQDPNQLSMDMMPPMPGKGQKIMEDAKKNAKEQKEVAKQKQEKLWKEKAEDFERKGKGQLEWFFSDLERVARNVNINFRSTQKIAKNQDQLFKEIRSNVKLNKGENIHSVLSGTFQVESTAQMKNAIKQLKDLGYEFGDMPKDLDAKQGFFIRTTLRKTEDDTVPKEIEFATAEYSKALEECRSKPNPLRESKMSLDYKIEADRVPEIHSLTQKLLAEAGEGLGECWITGGLPGSGKSTILSQDFHENKVVIDPDKIKYMLGAERGVSKELIDKNPSDYHEESSILAKHLIREMIRNNRDVVYDVTMKGTENIKDIIELTSSDTFKSRVKFAHLPIEKGIERDRLRGERGGRTIGEKLYRKLYDKYPTHKAFGELKDYFDTFEVFSTDKPIGHNAELFYHKDEFGKEEIRNRTLHAEFMSKAKGIVKSFLNRWELKKAVENEFNTPEQMPAPQDDTEIIKKLLWFEERGIDRDIDPEQDFFELGILKMHGFIDENINLTEEGRAQFESRYGSSQI